MKIMKSNKKKVLFGICGGLSDAFSVDVTLIRLIVFFLCLITKGIGAVIYIIFAFVIPSEEPGAVETSDNDRCRSDEEFDSYFSD